MNKSLLINIFKHFLALVLTLIAFNQALKVSTDGFTLTALKVSLFGNNTEVVFSKSLELISPSSNTASNTSDSKKIGLELNQGFNSNTLLLDTDLSYKKHELTFTATEDLENAAITLKAKHLRLHGYEFDTSVLYKDIKLSNKTLDQQKLDLANFSAHKGEMLTLSFESKNDWVTIGSLQAKHQLSVIKLIALTVLSIFIYYLVIFPSLVAIFNKLCLLKVFLGTEIFIFLAIFMVMTAFAIFGFNVKGTSSVLDRRDLATFPKLIKSVTTSVIASNNENKTPQSIGDQTSQSYSFNNRFFEELNNYLSDRFGLRNLMLESNITVGNNTNTIFENGSLILNKQNNWITEKNLSNFTYSKDIMSKAIVSLKKAEDFFKSRGIEFYLVITPDVQEIYPISNPFMADNAKAPVIDMSNIDEIRDNLTSPVLFPSDELLNAKEKDFVYFKVDHHYTDFGAYTNYEALIHELSKKHVGLEAVSWDKLPHSTSKYVRSEYQREFSLGIETDAIGIKNDKHLDVDYNYFEPQPPYLDGKLQDGQQYRTWHNDNGYPLKVMTMGSSMNENINPFMAATFKDVYYARLNTGWKVDEFDIPKYRGVAIDYFKPDLVVLTITRANLTQFAELETDNTQLKP
ncbi:MAG: DHHW family protein [Succinatimonas sp.]|nr:DHHW family protein [Succinatimonas sp.]